MSEYPGPEQLEARFGFESPDDEFSCQGHARLIVEELALNRVSASIFFIYDWWAVDELV